MFRVRIVLRVPNAMCAMTSTEFDGRRVTLIQYLRDRTDQSDWHAVADAACDLRVLEAEHQAESQRALGKYAPIIERIRKRQPG